MDDLVILEELRKHISTKNDRCEHDLEKVLVEAGRARDPIVCWMREGKRVVVDGHRRLDICRKHGLAFDVLEIAFADMREAKHYMDINQFVRRNLDGAGRAVIIARLDKYLEEEKAAGRFDGNSSREIAKQLKISERQVFRGKQDAKAIEKVESSLRDKITSGELKVSSTTLRALAEMPEREQLNAAEQVKAGEFETIGQAVCGADADETPAAMDRKPAKKAKKPKLAAYAPVDTLPLDSEPASTHDSGDLLQAAIKALGMLGKAMDALNEQSPNQPRMSSVGGHISNIRNILKNWAREAA